MTDKKPAHFIKTLIDKDLESGKHQSLQTRFPPEPNGFLHIGHAKSICLNFGLAEAYSAQVESACNLRFDDTNPEKEDINYVESIKADIEWLGFQWAGKVRYASDYFQALYDFAEQLLEQGDAYVCSLSPEQAREHRGSLTEPGTNSPDRDRTVAENLDLFRRMRAGEFKEGELALRAKIDMASPNMNMRDPIIYRIRFVEHHQTGNSWCIYPMYDFTHCLSDAIEGITHSLCTLEFADHRPLYEWFLRKLNTPAQPKQIEFARLNLNYTITSKRKLLMLVEQGLVNGWDDPRMPTISALRRRGYTPGSIRQFCEAVGVARNNSVVDMGMLEFAIRDDLDKNATRAMCVLRPLEVVIDNYPVDGEQMLSLPSHPKDESMGRRDVPFSGRIYIDQADFSENPPAKWKRLSPEHPIRLRGAYVIKFKSVELGDDGEPVRVHCEYDPDTLGKNPEGYKAKGVIHWVSAEQNVPAEVRLYDRLFLAELPDADKDARFVDMINPDSLEVLDGALAEISLKDAAAESRFQFEREGYFCVDRFDSTDSKMVFNRVVGLRDNWSKP